MINVKMITNVLGILLVFEALAMAISVAVSYLYNESDFYPFVYSTLITGVTGAIVWLNSFNYKRTIGKREGYIIVSLVWIVFALFGSLPFLFSGATTNFTDAYFEAISGYTTTGATTLININNLPHGILFWRSTTQWLGGMSIIILFIAIQPILGLGNMRFFVSESTSNHHTKEKVYARVKETAKKLFLLYIGFTLFATLALAIGGMSFFDAINHAMTTVSTGGFSTKQAGIAYYNSPVIEYMLIIFMFIAGINFTLTYLAMQGKFKRIWKNEELRSYIITIVFYIIIFITTIAITTQSTIGSTIRDSLFHVISILSTTGFTSNANLNWIPFLSFITFVLLFIGSSTGSSGGGVKVIRVLILLKHSYLEIRRLIHPHAIIQVRYNKKMVSKQLVVNILGFIVLYIFLFAFGSLVMSSMQIGLQTAMNSIACALANISSGSQAIGLQIDYTTLPNFGKWFLSLFMIIGRLELFTILVIFSPFFWKN